VRYRPAVLARLVLTSAIVVGALAVAAFLMVTQG
jgi:hypothetical protein